MLGEATCRVVVIGAGSIGMRHLRILGGMPGVEAIAVPTRLGRVDELRKASLKAVADLREAARTGATYCIVATDTARHMEDSLNALGEQFHVLVEKPLSVDAGRAQYVWSRFSQAGKRLAVGCVLRFSESLNRFRDFLSGIGRLHSVRIECQSYLPDWRPERNYHDSYSARASEGGVLRDLIHEIDYAGWLFGWPVAIQARVRNLGRLGIEAEEAADLTWEAAGGAIVSVSLDYLTRPPRRYMRAVGERGTLEWDGIEGTTTLTLAGAPVEIVCSSQTRDDMFSAQARAFIDACDGNGDSRLATGEDGVKALATCDAARKASHSGREEKVEYP